MAQAGESLWIVGGCCTRRPLSRDEGVCHVGPNPSVASGRLPPSSHVPAVLQQFVRSQECERRVVGQRLRSRFAAVCGVSGLREALRLRLVADEGGEVKRLSVASCQLSVKIAVLIGILPRCSDDAKTFHVVLSSAFHREILFQHVSQLTTALRLYSAARPIHHWLRLRNRCRLLSAAQFAGQIRLRNPQSDRDRGRPD